MMENAKNWKDFWTFLNRLLNNSKIESSQNCYFGYNVLKRKIIMLKIVVFDGGCGGEAVAEYLAEELQVVEIIQVIDWKHAPYDNKTSQEVCQLADELLRKYIGKVDLIVLGGYTVSMALEFLQGRYTEQKFIGMGVNYYRILKSKAYPERITVIMNEQLVRDKLCEELHENLPFSTLAIPDCSGWEDLTNKSKLSIDILRRDLGTYFELRPKSNREMARERAMERATPMVDRLVQEKRLKARGLQNSATRRLIRSDAVLILNTNCWRFVEELEYVFGYRARVLDFRQKLLHDVCTALGLLGVDGERSK